MAKKDKRGKKGRKPEAVTPSYPTYASRPPASTDAPSKRASAPDQSASAPAARSSSAGRDATPAPRPAAAPAPASEPAPPVPAGPVPLQVEVSAMPATLPLSVEVTTAAATVPLVVEVQQAPGRPLEAPASDPDRPRVSVTGTGRVERPSDIARATVVVEATRHTAAEARSMAASTAAGVLSAVEGAGVARGDINTAGLDVSPNWEHEGNRPVRKGFTVTNRITVVIRDLEQVGAVLDAALESGATGLDGVSFQLADTSADATEARRRAVADARERAETIASAAGMRLGRLVGIAETGSPMPMPRREMRMAAMAMDAGAPPTPVMPGSVEVTVSVSAEWELLEG